MPGGRSAWRLWLGPMGRIWEKKDDNLRLCSRLQNLSWAALFVGCSRPLCPSKNPGPHPVEELVYNYVWVK